MIQADVLTEFAGDAAYESRLGLAPAATRVQKNRRRGFSLSSFINVYRQSLESRVRSFTLNGWPSPSRASLRAHGRLRRTHAAFCVFYLISLEA